MHHSRRKRASLHISEKEKRINGGYNFPPVENEEAGFFIAIYSTNRVRKVRNIYSKISGSYRHNLASYFRFHVHSD